MHMGSTMVTHVASGACQARRKATCKARQGYTQGCPRERPYRLHIRRTSSNMWRTSVPRSLLRPLPRPSRSKVSRSGRAPRPTLDRPALGRSASLGARPSGGMGRKLAGGRHDENTCFRCGGTKACTRVRATECELNACNRVVRRAPKLESNLYPPTYAIRVGEVGRRGEVPI